MRGSSIFLNIIPIIIITNIDRHHPRHNRRYHQQYHDEYYLTRSMKWVRWICETRKNKNSDRGKWGRGMCSKLLKCVVWCGGEVCVGCPALY